MRGHAQVLVVGAGPAGLAVAACLRQRWVPSLVVERDRAVGQRWRSRYDRLHLHTPRVQSHLPGLRMPRSFGRWVSRDDVARYLASYARYHGIALAEAGARRVWLSVRTPPNVVPRTVGPIPSTLLAAVQDPLPAAMADPVNRLVQRGLVGDLRRYGLPVARHGVLAQFRATGVVPIIDVGLVAQLRAGRVEPVAGIAGFEDAEVVLSDGRRLRPGAVVAATGYSTGLQPVVGHLGVLDGAGRPRVHGAATAPQAPGLRFVGVLSPFKGLLLQINLDARAAARAIARELGAGRRGGRGHRLAARCGL